MKRRFRFRLARLRRVRDIEERVARAEWSNAEATWSDADREKERRRAELETARADLARRLADRQPLDPAWIGHVHDALDGQTEALGRAHEAALTRRAQADALADAWRERERDRRALAELEERDRTRHRRELERHEGRELDEQALLRRAAADRSARPDGTAETDSSPPRPPAD